MRKIGEALRMTAAGLSTRQIAARLSVGRSTVGAYLKRVERAGLTWPRPEGPSEADLERRLFAPTGGQRRRGLAEPDRAAVHRELRRKGVTLSLIWEEYRANHPGDGYGDSRFCALYRRWEGRLSPVSHRRCAFGATASSMSPVSGSSWTTPATRWTSSTARPGRCARLRSSWGCHAEGVPPARHAEGVPPARRAEGVPAARRASSDTYAEATWTQSLPDWIGAQVRMLAFFGGVPGQVVSDTLKSGVTKACFHEPGLNRSYADMAAHDDTAVIPARPRKPRE